LREPDDRAAHPEMRGVGGNRFSSSSCQIVASSSTGSLLAPAATVSTRSVRSGRPLIRDWKNKWRTGRRDGQGGGGGGAILFYTQISDPQALHPRRAK
jgi:hypothetical protein